MSNNIVFYHGEMGCGKTQNLINLYNDLKNKNINVILVKPDDHIRDGSYAKSRNGNKIQAQPLSIVLKNGLKNVDFLLLDEVQFASVNDLKKLVKICDENNIDMIMYGLYNHAMMEPFETSAYAAGIADSVIRIPTQCANPDCKNQALVSARLKCLSETDSLYSIIHDGEIVDQTAMYTPLCRNCYHLNTIKINSWHVRS